MKDPILSIYFDSHPERTLKETRRKVRYSLHMELTRRKHSESNRVVLNKVNN